MVKLSKTPSRLLVTFLLSLVVATAAHGSQQRVRSEVAARAVRQEARAAASSSDGSWRRVRVRLTGGLGELGGGDVNDGVALWSGLFENELRRWVFGLRPDGGEPAALRHGADFGADVIVHLTRHVAIVGGVGRIQGSGEGVIENAIEFGRYLGRSTRNATALRVRSVPLRLGAQYTTPVGRRVTLSVEGGAGVYFTHLSWLHDFVDRDGRSSSWVSETHGHDLGVHGGVWLDVGLSDRIGLVFGAEAVRADVGGLHGFREGTFNYQAPTRTEGALALSGFSRFLVVGEGGRWLGAALPPVREAKAGLSGLRFKGGLRVGL